VSTINESPLLERLREFVLGLGGVFRRSDQARWAAFYLLGLIGASGRRNIESLARAIVASGPPLTEDIAQGLGHFLSHSPWDESRIWRHVTRSRAGMDGLFVLEEMTFVKQGRHSVGVHRQHSRTLGRKANCQLAVTAYHVSATAAPLGIRLYLPRAWLTDPARIETAGVPVAFRRPLDRSGIGLELLRAARDAGVQVTGVASGPGWTWTDDGVSALRTEGFTPVELPADARAQLDRTRHRLDDLGLGHFEGRLWRGFHHHTSLVALAEAFGRTDQGRG
jgi:SRSO17 transposase